MSTRSQRVCQMNGQNASYHFALKCIMKAQSYLVICLSLFIAMFYFGYLIKLFDENLNEASGKNFSDMTNMVWLAIVTMTTVGYGDFFPLSTMSRIVGIFCSFYGVYVVSLFVISINNLLVFDQSEERALDLICRLDDKEELKMEAVNVLTLAYRQRKAQKENESQSAVLKIMKNFSAHLRKFTTVAKRIRGNY